jgi:hypothetical protein
VVVDNYATHKHQRVQAWLATHPRVHLHFTPTYGSWLNLVEAFFAIIQRQALGRGDFASVDELVAAIRRFCDGWNQRCQPFAFCQGRRPAPGQAQGATTAASGHQEQVTTSRVGSQGCCPEPRSSGLLRPA